MRNVTTISSWAKYDRSLVLIKLSGNGAGRVGANVCGTGRVGASVCGTGRVGANVCVGGRPGANVGVVGRAETEKSPLSAITW